MLDRAIPPQIRKPSLSAVQKPVRIILSNGVPLHVFAADESEVVRLDLLFGGGRWHQEYPLQALFTNRMLREGTVRFSSDCIAERLDYYGAWLELASAAEYTYLTLYSLSKYLPQTLDVLESVVKEAVFPEKELKVVLETNIRQFLVNSSKTDFLAQRKLMHVLYGSTHPAGHVLCEEDYLRLTPEMLRSFYRRYYHSSNCSLYLAGQVDEACIRLVEEHFGREPFGDVANHKDKRVYVPCSALEKDFFIEREGAAQSTVRMGMLTLNQHHPDYLKFRVLVTLFGGYFGSRLMANIREEKGYTYGISATLLPYPGEGVFAISADTTCRQVDSLIREVYVEMERLGNELMAEDELARVRHYMLGEMCRSYESVFSLSDAWMFIHISGLQDSYFADIFRAINTVTAHELRELARKYLCKENLKVVVCGEKVS